MATEHSRPDERPSADDPRQHARKIKTMIDDLARHIREDVRKVHDPRAEALFETTAEMLDGLRRAYDHFERRSEPAWRD